MKLVRLGAALLAMVTVGLSPVIALTDKQITEKLNTIPAFAIVNKSGSPLVGRVNNPNNKDETGVIPIFIDATLAKKNYDDFKKAASPEDSKSYQVVPISLGEAFEAARAEGQNKDSKVKYYFQAAVSDLEKALTLAKKTDPKLTEFPGIPVFFLGKDGQPTITIARGSEQIVPFFFSEQDLQQQWTQVKKDKPDIAAKADIQVANLLNVLSFMLDPKNEQVSQNITFVPTADALKQVDVFQKALPAEFKGAATEAKPAAPKAKPATKPPAAKPPATKP